MCKILLVGYEIFMESHVTGHAVVYFSLFAAEALFFLCAPSNFAGKSINHVAFTWRKCRVSTRPPLHALYNHLCLRSTFSAY